MRTITNQEGVFNHAAAFNDHLKSLLKSQLEYLSDSGELLLAKVRQHALSNNPILIKLLLSDAKAKKTFFTNVEGALVFNYLEFIQVLEMSEYLTSSYTKYTNKIGLTAGGTFLSRNDDVVLAFPYKDAVLVGGQDKEDQRRNEVFLHEVIGREQITNLLAPKVLTNPIRYEGKQIDGKTWKVEQSAVTEVLDSDNLIIKGNNLVALSTLLRRHRGRIKCIYIDPPYYFSSNRDADSFKYNPNFKLSTWLNFMQSRLMLARHLLSEQGVLLCNINEEGLHWLKVLCEEIFGADNFVETFIWKNTDNAPSLSKKSRGSVEYVLCYEKNKMDNSIGYKGKLTENSDAPLLNAGNKVSVLTFPAGSIRFKIKDDEYTGSYDKINIIGTCNVKNGTNINNVTLEGEFKWSQSTLDNEVKNGTYFLVKSNKFSIRFQRKEGGYMAPEKFIDDQYLSKAIGVGTNEDASRHLEDLKLDFTYSKPESLISFFLNAMTNPGDFILDFFLGSGTTAVVAHKMGRRYIGIEQMDYIQEVTVERLKKVIEGEQGGVSKSVEWQGGGGFVYCELMENGMDLIAEIAKATNDTINALRNKVFSDDRITGLLSKEELEKASIEFEALSLEDKKKALITLVDKNKLYVNLHDINDADYKVSDEVKQFNMSFYNL